MTSFHTAFDPDVDEATPQPSRMRRVILERRELRRALARLAELPRTTELLVQEREALTRRLARLERRADQLVLEAALTDYGGEGD